MSSVDATCNFFPLNLWYHTTCTNKHIVLFPFDAGSHKINFILFLLISEAMACAVTRTKSYIHLQSVYIHLTTLNCETVLAVGGICIVTRILK